MSDLSNLEGFRDKTFSSFDSTVPGLAASHTAAVQYAQRPVGWLTFCGGYGCGKTHLAAAIANTLLDHDIPVLFVVVPDWLDALRRSFRDDSGLRYDQQFDAVKEAPVVVLDDLGTESGTPWAQEQIYRLVNFRYNARLATVFTTNVTMEHLDPRVASRLHDPSVPASVLVIRAADYRRRADDYADQTRRAA